MAVTFGKDTVAIRDASISARVESLREEIRLIQNQERFYQTLKRNSFEQLAAHARRELRVLDIETELQKLQSARHRAGERKKGRSDFGKNPE